MAGAVAVAVTPEEGVVVGGLGVAAAHEQEEGEEEEEKDEGRRSVLG